MSYGYAQRRSCQRWLDPVSPAVTVTYAAMDRRWLLHSPHSSDSIADEAEGRFRELFADRATPAVIFYIHFTLHPWFVGIRNSIVSKRVRIAGLPPHSAQDIAQSINTSLWETFQNNGDFRAWLAGACNSFHGWSYLLLDNHCQPAVRVLRQQMLGNGKVRFESLEAADRNALADHRVPLYVTAEQLIDLKTKLARFPERTQQVLRLRAEGFTWDEVAAELGISVDAAKWARSCWLKELEETFGSGI